MPIYEYHCSGCSREFELLVRGDESPECPECGGTQLSKLISLPAAHSAGGVNPPGCPTECNPRSSVPM